MSNTNCYVLVARTSDETYPEKVFDSEFDADAEAKKLNDYNLLAKVIQKEFDDAEKELEQMLAVITQRQKQMNNVAQQLKWSISEEQRAKVQASLDKMTANSVRDQVQFEERKAEIRELLCHKYNVSQIELERLADYLLRTYEVWTCDMIGTPK